MKLRTFFRLQVGLLVTTIWAARAGSQPGTPPAAAPAAAAAPTVVSPEVHPDRRITLRLHAPKATDVTVAGEWSEPKANTPQKLTRDAAGLWSITVGPVEPNIYIYVFNVDGVTITDPVNPLVKLRARTNASMVEVPGGKPWDFRDVPHGTLQLHTHAASTLGGAPRQVFVYTPPGYEKRTGARYPVVYLLHGNNDLAAGWTMAGRANLILDNLIAEKKAVPMVVVMPWGHALPFGARPPEGQPTNNDVFETYLLKDVVPLIESHYRLSSDRRQRAVVGLSMGGAQALQIGLRHPQRFGTVGLFGAGMTRADFDVRYGALFAGVKTSKSTGKSSGGPRRDLLFIGVGKQDGVLARARELAEALRDRGELVTYHETDGGHTYPVWRKLLVEAAPSLFQNKPHH